MADPRIIATRTEKICKRIDARLARIEEKLGLTPLESAPIAPIVTPVHTSEPPKPEPQTAADLAAAQTPGQPPVTLNTARKGK